MRSFSPTRRFALKSLTAASALLVLSPGGCASAQRAIHFLHGVASGDPLQNAVILWTRAQAEDGKPVRLIWEVSADQSFARPVATGKVTAAPTNDFIAKVDAIGLSPGLTYWYRFRTEDDQTSPVGRTKTLPEGPVDQVRFAVMSCSNYPAGYFNAYKAAAEHGDIDAAIHLGDYIYEYGVGGYASEEAEKMGRIVKPEGETITLDDYRTRYGIYRMDEDLQALHAAMPMIAVWDDHEITNNAWKDGAQNHDDSEGSYEDRLEAALRAYLEWLPIRENPAGKDRLYRSFDYGDLARLVMLDTRYIGRDEQLVYSRDAPDLTWPFDVTDPDNPVPLRMDEDRTGRPIQNILVPFDLSSDPPSPITDLKYVHSLDRDNMPDNVGFLPDLKRFAGEAREEESREMLGLDQAAFLNAQLSGSRAKGQVWQVLGQQVLMGRVNAVDFSDLIDPAALKYDYQKRYFSLLSALAKDGLPGNLDSWEGYPAARRRAYQDFNEGDNGNVVVLSGDTHNSWAFNLQNTQTGEPVGVEFATPSITSPGVERSINVPAEVPAQRFVEASPDLKWADMEHRGFLVVTLTRSEARADWVFVDTIKSKEFKARIGHTEIARPGARRLV